MQESLYQTADAGVLIRQRMQESLYQTADAKDSIKQEADAELSISDSGSKKFYITQQMQRLYITDS